MSRQKYNARRTLYDGIWFASKREAARYAELNLLERAGEISDLKLQPSFELQPAFVHNGKRERAIRYVADFEYIEKGVRIVEDVKGVGTPVFKLKRKMMLFVHGIEIRVTK